MIVAIDGPAASGKGTLAQALAKKLDLLVLDTGKLYRLVASRLLAAGADLQTLTPHSEETAIMAACQHIILQDLQDERLRDERIGKAASIVSANFLVRRQLIPVQRDLARNVSYDKNGVVLDGRDIGTVIFPDADYKFFLVADIEIRAKRRHQELRQRGSQSLDIAQIKALIMARDETDSHRMLAPLKPADDAIHLDSTKMTIDEMIAAAIAHIIPVR